MKRTLVIIALGAILTSCQWIAQNVYSVEDCVEWYCDELYEAAVDGDKKEFIELLQAFNTWEESLNDADWEIADEAFYDWDEDNSVKSEVIDNYIDELDL